MAARKKHPAKPLDDLQSERIEFRCTPQEKAAFDRARRAAGHPNLKSWIVVTLNTAAKSAQ